MTLASLEPIKYFINRKSLVPGLSMVFTRAEILRALLLHIKSMRPRPPLWTGTDRDLLQKVSILDPHRKGKTSFLNCETTHSGVGKTLARNQNLLAQRIFMTRTFPTKDKERHFHRLT